MSTGTHETWMRRCLELARLGAGHTAPNPMVGSVLVQQGRMLAEGWHHAAGSPHAEVECLRAFGDGPVPADAVLYVNLEPCAHHGRTPPCAELLIQRGVEHVVVGIRDPFPAVAGKGIAMLRDAGVQVTENILVEECRWAQRRFLTSITLGRPFIILKWARSADGFLDRHPRRERAVQRISGPATDVLVHTWRAHEQAILVGSRTVLNDDPSLSVRHVHGKQPIRIVLDRKGITPATSKVYDNATTGILFTEEVRPGLPIEQVLIATTEDPIDRILHELHRRSVRSVLIEGGAELHQHFMDRGLWDELRVIIGKVEFAQGTRAPETRGTAIRMATCGKDRIDQFVNASSPVIGSTTAAATWD
ncbi:MAG: bifunctional diaminohydroxyphosphoribosylaminopyrimidine deaminase/5-amino-6-(5-phosphoribosylamino)uracil reductase RibD [Flavobacteriales bacterium]